MDSTSFISAWLLLGIPLRSVRAVPFLWLGGSNGRHSATNSVTLPKTNKLLLRALVSQLIVRTIQRQVSLRAAVRAVAGKDFRRGQLVTNMREFGSPDGSAPWLAAPCPYVSGDVLNVVAITVFFLLAVAFYAFFAPFLGSDVLQYAAVAVYTPTALAVFLLYIRSSAIDPADPGILANFGHKSFSTPEKKPEFSASPLVLDLGQAGTRQSPVSTPARSSSDVQSGNKHSFAGGGTTTWNKAEDTGKTSCKLSFLNIGCLLCGWLVKDDCCKDEGVSQQQVAGDDALFCTLCNAEVAYMTLC
eukprot:Gb_33255 [translate_table: standard]